MKPSLDGNANPSHFGVMVYETILPYFTLEFLDKNEYIGFFDCL